MTLIELITADFDHGHQRKSVWSVSSVFYYSYYGIFNNYLYGISWLPYLQLSQHSSFCGL